MTVAEIVAASAISKVWIALGGEAAKNGRARAFFRDGDNAQAVSLDDAKGCFFDHRDGQGGGILDLVSRVLDCDRQDAIRWLAEFNGAILDDRQMTTSERSRYAARKSAEESERRNARWWAATVEILVDEFLESATVGDEIANLTALRRAARNPNEAELLGEFRAWSAEYPRLTKAMVSAGRQHEERVQILVAQYVVTLGRAEAANGAAS